MGDPKSICTDKIQDETKIFLHAIMYVEIKNRSQYIVPEAVISKSVPRTGLEPAQP